jgi:hypothetical protein
MFILFALGAVALLGVASLETKLNSNAQRRKADKAVGEASLARLREQETFKAASKATKERERLEREGRQARHEHVLGARDLDPRTHQGGDDAVFHFSRRARHAATMTSRTLRGGGPVLKTE